MITGKILKLRGWPDGKVIGLAKVAAVALESAGYERDAILDTLDAVRAAPGDYLASPTLAPLARECLRRFAPPEDAADTALREAPEGYTVVGGDLIESQAVAQLRNALRLPVAVAGALMPDAHIGYGLPVGGVLAAREAVIPYAVGVDIACRMRLSIYEVSPIVLGQRKGQFRTALRDQTRFGMRGGWERSERPEHPVLGDPAWRATRLLQSLRIKAEQQLGTSGSGNHFVEWGTLRLHADVTAVPGTDRQGLRAGTYLALLSHSGSRGVGFKIANTYTEVAQRLHPTLDPSVRHLAWLGLETEPGQEYWLSMQLAARFAEANHEVIHRRVAGSIGLRELAVIENHHNLAWRETLADGTQAIVHRKGATPAGAGVLGVIPGSMGDAGYVVRGRGNAAALNSAAHGAGRALGRKAALGQITEHARDEYLKERGVTLLGGGVDEAPQAYKDIRAVIAAQADLVEVLGTFTPAIVRMADEAGAY